MNLTRARKSGLMGTMLRVRRRELAETLETVSRRSGIGVGRLSEYERSLRVPHPATFRRLARAYTLPLTAFLLLETGLAIERKMAHLVAYVTRERRKLREVLDLQAMERPREGSSERQPRGQGAGLGL